MRKEYTGSNATFGKGSDGYWEALDILGLSKNLHTRIDPTSYTPYSSECSRFIIAPVIEDHAEKSDGNFQCPEKIGWQIYYDNPAFEGVKETIDFFDTKEEAIASLKYEINWLKSRRSHDV